jgi:hypothetical protein
MRLLLTLGSTFVFVAGIQLYLLSAHTERFFAWTIVNPLTAATIGGFYLGAVSIGGLSACQRRWDLARVGVPGILVFLWLTLIASLTHLAIFHIHANALPPRLAAGGWLLIYLVEPPLLSLAWILQRSGRAVDPPSAAPMPIWYRVVCLLVAGPVFGFGVALYLVPVRLGRSWAWPLTPIAAQTLAAWFTALAVLLAAVAVERDWQRCRPASAGMLTLGLAQLVALARYPDAPHGPLAIVWITLMVLVGLLGGYGSAVSFLGTWARRSTG